MKLKNIIFSTVVIAGVGFLASCGGDKKVAPAPTVTFQTGTGFTSGDVISHVDSTLKIGIVALSNDASLSEIKIALSVNGAASGTIKDSIVGSKNVTFTYKYKVAGVAGDVQTITVTAIDKNGQTASVSLKVSINPETKALALNATQKVFNLQGPPSNPGAYDLNNSVNVPSSGLEAIKDLKDMTLASGGAVFADAWTSGNGGKFVRVTLNDWTNASSTDYLFNLWKTSSAAATLSLTKILKDDIILVKTGQTTGVPFPYYIIKITSVYSTAAAGDNNDYIQFDYKGL